MSGLTTQRLWREVLGRMMGHGLLGVIEYMVVKGRQQIQYRYRNLGSLVLNSGGFLVETMTRRDKTIVLAVD